MASRSSSLLGRHLVNSLQRPAGRTLASRLVVPAPTHGRNPRRENAKSLCTHAKVEEYKRSAKTAPLTATHRSRRSMPADLASQHRRMFSAEHNTQKSSLPDANTQPIIHDLFEKKTGTWQYVVADPATMKAVIIDPVMDYDPVTRVMSTESADDILSLVESHGYEVDRILETHIHADHLTAAWYLQYWLDKQYGLRPAISVGKRIVNIQELFRRRYGLADEETNGVFDAFFDDDEVFHIGNLTAQALHLPGHTPDHMGFKIGGKSLLMSRLGFSNMGNNIFCGDSVFHADIGTARCDFPGGSAERLYESGRKLLSFPDNVKIWTGHDYPPEGRSDPVPYLSVGGHRAQNKHLMDGLTKGQFIAVRQERDAKLGAPRLLHQSLQMNIRAGRLPKPTPSGDLMLHTPLNVKQVRL